MTSTPAVREARKRCQRLQGIPMAHRALFLELVFETCWAVAEEMVREEAFYAGAAWERSKEMDRESRDESTNPLFDVFLKATKRTEGNA